VIYLVGVVQPKGTQQLLSMPNQKNFNKNAQSIKTRTNKLRNGRLLQATKSTNTQGVKVPSFGSRMIALVLKLTKPCSGAFSLVPCLIPGWSQQLFWDREWPQTQPQCTFWNREGICRKLWHIMLIAGVYNINISKCKYKTLFADIFSQEQAMTTAICSQLAVAAQFSY